MFIEVQHVMVCLVIVQDVVCRFTIVSSHVLFIFFLKQLF